jgi:hypothetical protein
MSRGQLAFLFALGALALAAVSAGASSGPSLEATLTGERAAPGPEGFSVYAAPSAALSLDGTTAIVGDPAQKANAGVVWVYVRSGVHWSQQAQLASPADATGSFPFFGMTAAVTPDGNTAFLGGATSGRGAVWIYKRSGSSWTEAQKLDPPDETTEFGFRVALSQDGTILAVTALNNDGQQAGVYLYAHSGSAWGLVQKIPYPSDSGTQILFGTSVALSGNGSTVLVGASLDDGNKGAYRAYVRGGSGWTEQAKISPAANDAFFSGPVALSRDGNTALLSGGGETLVYTRSGSSWTRKQKLTLADGTSVGSNLGNTLALSADGTTAFVDGSSASRVGFLWKFVLRAGQWTADSATTLPASAGDPAALALSGDEARVLLNGSAAALIYRTAATQPAGPKRVTVAVAVKGKGRVKGGAIDCPGRCTATIPAGAKLTLRPAAAVGYRFAGWTSGCSGVGACTLHPRASVHVTATFRKR